MSSTLAATLAVLFDTALLRREGPPTEKAFPFAAAAVVGLRCTEVSWQDCPPGTVWRPLATVLRERPPPEAPPPAAPPRPPPLPPLPDCSAGVCTGSVDETCYYELRCAGSSMAGCNAGGKPTCRFCGFGAFASIPCPPPL